MDAELERVSVLITEAAYPEDLFGAEEIVLPPQILMGYVGKKYQALFAKTDPNIFQHPDDVEVAKEACTKLAAMYAKAESKIRKQLYGLEGWGRSHPRSVTKSFDVGPHRYFIGELLERTEHANFYNGYLEAEGQSLGEVMIKVAITAAENEFLENEARMLNILHSQEVAQWKHLPLVVEQFRSGDRVGLILRKQSGFTLTQIRQHPLHKNGVDQRHMIWMLDRLLSCAGYAHKMGIVHRNLNSDHIRIQPRDHNAIVSGWSAAVHKPASTRERIRLTQDRFTAPEVIENGAIGPWSDVYSIGALMIWLLGGDTETLNFPSTVAPEIQKFLSNLVVKDYRRRPSDAWELFEQENVLKDRLWERKYLPFDML